MRDDADRQSPGERSHFLRILGCIVFAVPLGVYLLFEMLDGKSFRRDVG